MNVAILVGGRGGRIGGEKGMLKLCGRTFVEILVERFVDCEVVLVCRDEEQAELYSEFGDTVVDEVENFGPLAGIYSALRHFKDFTLVVAVDMPLVRRELSEFIFDTCAELKADALVPTWSDGRIEPLLACYSYGSIEKIRRCIEMGERRVYKAVKSMNAVYYPIEMLRRFDDKLLSFVNVNTYEDYEKLIRVVGCSSTGTADL